MESIKEQKGPRKEDLLVRWIENQCQQAVLSIKAMQGDASFRQYFRVHTEKGTMVAMIDADPPNESRHTFAPIANSLRDLGVMTPEIYAVNDEAGFLLLTDFGDQTYLKILTTENADQLYRNALMTLALMQQLKQTPTYTLPLFTDEWMWKEWAWHKEWFLTKWLGLPLSVHEEKGLNGCVSKLIHTAITQPQTFMHRDYHSANLMRLADNQVGVLDFQDAFMGPLTYDLVSLLRDSYLAWPDEKVTEWALFYKMQLNPFHGIACVSNDEFLYWFDWMGLERHLKTLFTFARKAVRDHQPSYLQHVPRVLNYLVKVSERYDELSYLYTYFSERVIPTVETMRIPCAP